MSPRPPPECLLCTGACSWEILEAGAAGVAQHWGRLAQCWHTCSLSEVWVNPQGLRPGSVFQSLCCPLAQLSVPAATFEGVLKPRGGCEQQISTARAADSPSTAHRVPGHGLQCPFHLSSMLSS